MILTQIDANQVRQYGRELLFDQTGLTSFASIAQHCTELLFRDMLTPTGEPAFALLRIFRAGSSRDLPANLQHLTTTPTSLALMGTAGIESAWQDREQSRRQVIPIDMHMSPMFKGIFGSLGFRWEDFSNDSVPQGHLVNMPVTRFFFVPQALHNSFITDQASFVIPYHIQSVIAVGSFFLSGSAYVMIGFTRIALTDNDANAFAEIAPYISTLLAQFDGKNRIW